MVTNRADSYQAAASAAPKARPIPAGPSRWLNIIPQADFSVNRLTLLKELHGPFMLLRRCQRWKRSQIPPLARLRILLSRIQPILPRNQFPNHAKEDAIGESVVGRKPHGAKPCDGLS